MSVDQTQSSLKKRALSAILWNATQKYGTLIIAFFSNIILARLLSPGDFGLVGLLTVFISVANVIAESGFNSALIQRKDVDEVDYNTVFYWNIFVSIFLVIILFFTAPLIAQYFDRPILSELLRVESIILIINSFCIVQTTRLMKFLKFRILAVRSIIATVCSTIVGVVLAWQGYGVWALVWQAIVAATMSAVLLWSITDWRPSLQYDWGAFRRMFKFGAYISVSSLCNTLYINLQSFIIGKSFSIADLGFYSQAKKLETIPVDGTASVLNAVLFPVYATIVDDRERHIRLVRKNVKIITFITFPLMMMLILVAPYLFPILFTDKWNASIPMFQILCVFGMFSPLNMANVEIFRSIGEGKVYLFLQTIKRVLGITIILFFVRYGLFVLLWTIAAIGIITYILNIVFTHKIFGYSYSKQLSDMIPNLLLSGMVFLIFEFLFKIISGDSNWLYLICGSIGYGLSYLAIAYIFHYSSFKILREVLKRT